MVPPLSQCEFLGHCPSSLGIIWKPGTVISISWWGAAICIAEYNRHKARLFTHSETSADGFVVSWLREISTQLCWFQNLCSVLRFTSLPSQQGLFVTENGTAGMTDVTLNIWPRILSGFYTLSEHPSDLSNTFSTPN